MSVGRLAKRVGASVAATAAAGTFAALAFTASPAGATQPASGDIVPGTAQPKGSFTPGPFDSGQTINVVIPANSAFAGATSTGINILMCSAPNGVVPTSPSACDGNTIQGDTIFPSADGSFTYGNYQLFALPDSLTLGEGSSGITCGNTPATECMLYVGQSQLDFTKPHLWSQPFFVNSNSNDAGANPGDGTPEVPMAVILPIAGLGLLGGTVLVRNRRRAARA